MNNSTDYMMPPLVFLLEDEDTQREAVTNGFKNYFSMFNDPSIPTANDFEAFPSYDMALERLMEEELLNRPLIGIFDYDMSGAIQGLSKKPSSALVYEMNKLTEQKYDHRMVMGIIYSGQALNAFQDPVFNQWESDIKRYGEMGDIPPLLRLSKGSASKLSADIKIMGSLIGYTCRQLSNTGMKSLKSDLSKTSEESNFNLYEFGKNLSKRR